MIRLSTLGTFCVTDGEKVMDESWWKSAKVGKLFVYLAKNRDRALGIDEISGAVWQDEEQTDNPGGALKNLIYRLRKGLKETFGENDYIIASRRGSYRWNPEVEISLDIEEFDTLLKEADVLKHKDIEAAISKYEKAVDLYNGDFMAAWADIHWVMTLNTYYHSLYITAVKSLAELYIAVEKYEELEMLCNSAIAYEHGDEQLYCYLIQARMRMKKVQLAFESYEKARSIMDKELGVRKTVMLNKVYEELLSVTKGQSSYDIDEIKEDINDDDMDGVFFCGYPVFKEIYHLEVRKSERTPVPQNLLLITFCSKINNSEVVLRYRYEKAMESLENVLRMCLRVGDVAAKYSDTQYIILLSKCEYDLAPLVADRIVKKFKKQCQLPDTIEMKIDIEPVSRYNSLVKEDGTL